MLPFTLCSLTDTASHFFENKVSLVTIDMSLVTARKMIPIARATADDANIENSHTHTHRVTAANGMRKACGTLALTRYYTETMKGKKKKIEEALAAAAAPV